MSRQPLARWLGWSVAAHLTVGAALWLAWPRIHAPSLPAPEAAAAMVALVDAPAPEPHAPIPRSRLSTWAAPRVAEPIDRSTPDRTANKTFEEHAPDAPAPTFVSEEPHATASPIDTPPDAVAAVSPHDEPAVSAPDADEHGARTASVGAQDPGASTDEYRPLVLSILERAKRYPLLAQRRGIEGTVAIAFMIHPDGRLSDPELIVSSNHRVLDEAALAMVRRVGSVPPPPHSLPVRFPARIQYGLDQ